MDSSTKLDSCGAILDGRGIVRDAELAWAGSRWLRFQVHDATTLSDLDPFLVPSLPVDIHCHGIGPYDLSSLRPSDLPEINRLAREQGILCVPTVFCRMSYFETFLEVMAEFDRLRRSGEMTNLLGFALEGPLLGNIGGTPRSGSWIPEAHHWERLAECGPKGLLYAVLSPDLHALGDRGRQLDTGPDLATIVQTLVENGVRLSLGHFQRGNPERSAECIREVVDLVEEITGEPGAYHILTDHLFNDMPRNFLHAWRSPAERKRRDQDVAAFRRDPWKWERLDAQVGPVPAELLRAARDGRLTICLNFDGEHVDPVVCRATVELLGADRIMGMTDRTETINLAGHTLMARTDSTLYYQSEDIVAAGSQSIDRQIRTMRGIGLSESEIWEIYSFLPLRTLGLPVSLENANPPNAAMHVSSARDMTPLYFENGASPKRSSENGAPAFWGEQGRNVSGFSKPTFQEPVS